MRSMFFLLLTLLLPSCSSINISWSYLANSPKNQGPCGSCYAFTAVGLLELQYSIDHSEKIILNESSLNPSCAGGYVSDTLRQIQQFGVTTKTGQRYSFGRFNVISLSDEPHNTQLRKIRTALADGPIAITIRYWDNLWATGRYLRCSSTNPTNSRHSLIVTGYWNNILELRNSHGEAGPLWLDLGGAEKCGVFSGGNSYQIEKGSTFRVY